MSANFNNGTLRSLTRTYQQSSDSPPMNESGSAVVDTIRKRMQQMKDELATSQDELHTYQIEREREKHAREQAEAEVGGLQRRIQLVEEDFERTEERLNQATAKLDEASHAADESERKRLILDGKVSGSGNRYDTLEQLLKEAKQLGHMNERKHEEVARKLKVRESELERIDDRTQRTEAKIAQYEQDLKHLHYELRSKEVFLTKAMQREESYEEQIRDLTTRLKDAEQRADLAERTMAKLQKEVDRLEGDITAENVRSKSLQREMDSMINDLQNVL